MVRTLNADATIAINSATDLALAIFPATIIWQLNMKTTVKVSLIVMMGLGVLWVTSIHI